METKISYPIPLRQSFFYRRLRLIARIIFIAAALICLLVNFLTKGSPWSLIVVWSLVCLWNLLFSLRLVEFSFFSHAIKVQVYVIVLLILIDAYLAPGWAQVVVPIVLFSSLLVMLVIFYATYSKKDRHMMSILVLGFLSIIAIPYYTHSLPITNWVGFAFQIASFALFLILLAGNFKNVLRELKARFRVRSD